MTPSTVRRPLCPCANGRSRDVRRARNDPAVPCPRLCRKLLPANFMSSSSSSRTAATKRDLVGKLGPAFETACPYAPPAFFAMAWPLSPPTRPGLWLFSPPRPPPPPHFPSPPPPAPPP